MDYLIKINEIRVKIKIKIKIKKKISVEQGLAEIYRYSEEGY